MTWRTAAAVDDAVEATRRFLFPFRPVRWGILAFLLFAMATGVSAGVWTFVAADVFLTELVGSAGTGEASVTAAALRLAGGATADRLSLAVAVVAGGTAVALSVASLTLRLVFYDALETSDVRLFGPFFGRFRQAIGLFVAVVTLRAVAVGATALAAVVGVVSATPIRWAPIGSLAGATEALPVGSVVVAWALAGLAVLGASLALRLTYEFVVPTMVAEDIGVLAGWERVVHAVFSEWRESVAYLVVHSFVGLGSTLVGAVVVAILGMSVAAAGGVALLLVAALLGGLEALVGTTVGLVVGGLVTLAAVVALLLLTVPVAVLTRTYVITYEVAALGGIDPSVQLLDVGSETAATGGGEFETDAEVFETDAEVFETDVEEKAARRE